MNMKRVGAVVAAGAVSLLVLTGCAARPIDMIAADARPLGPGLSGSFYTCIPDDPGTALVFTQLPGSSENDYEFPLYDMQYCMDKYGVKVVPQSSTQSLKDDPKAAVEGYGDDSDD